MTSEIEIYSKDSIKLNILQEVISGEVKLAFQLNGGTADDYATQIHKDRSRVQVYGKFNISEDPNGELLTIRPVMIENSLKIIFQMPLAFSGKTASIVRSATKTVEREFEINSDVSYLEFSPIGKEKYVFRMAPGDKTDVYPPRNDSAGDDDRIEGFTIEAPPESEMQEERFAAFDMGNAADIVSTSNIQKKQSAIERLKKIEAEYKKDYESLEKELEEIKSRMEADSSVIEHYKDRDVVPIEMIFQEIKLKLEEAEDQIRLFIEAKQRKTMEIENEIKSNKK